VKSPFALRARSALYLSVLAALAGQPAFSAPTSVDDTASLRLSDSLMVVPHFAQPVGPSTVTPLTSLLTAATQGAASVRAADAGAQAAQGVEKQYWANAWMPRLDLSADKSKQNQSYNGIDLKVPASNIKLTATVPVWKASDRAIAKAQSASADQASWQAKAQRATVARELSIAYVTAAEAAEQHRLANAQLDLLQTQLHINDRRLQAGMGTVLDQLETRTRVDQIRATSQEQAMRAATQRLAIERLSGQAVTLPAGFNQMQAELPEQLPSLNDALQEAARTNPQLLGAQADVAAAKAVTNARHAEYWQPTVDALVWTQRQRQTQHFDGLNEPQNVNTHSAVGVQLNWPLFTGGQQTGRNQEAVALLTKSQANQDDALSTVQAGLRDAYQSLTQARAMMAAQRDLEQTATATFEAVRKAFVAGMRTNLDLLNAQQQIYTARQNQVSARVNALTAYCNILFYLDQLDEPHAVALSSQFDAAAMAN